MADETKFDEWAIVEVMGHQRYCGRCCEQLIAGHGFLRVDVPECSGRPSFTKLLGTSAIFAITPCTEEVARAMQGRSGSEAFNTYGLPQIAGPSYDRDDEPEY